MAPEDLARRRPVWAALSGLFLDTEVRPDVPLIARGCAESGYDDDMLEDQAPTHDERAAAVQRLLARGAGESSSLVARHVFGG